VSEFSYLVTDGADAGQMLTPHVHRDGCYVVSMTRFAEDYVRVPSGEPLLPWVQRGFSVRMSAPGRAPSLIHPTSIVVSPQRSMGTS
jgi:hypothetical protein